MAAPGGMRGRFRRFAAIALACACAAATAGTQYPSLQRTLELARTQAYRGQAVDWSSVEPKARAIAASRGEPDAIRFVLGALGDNHSFYLPVTEQTGRERAPRTDVTASPEPSPIAQDAGDVGGIPVLRVNAWAGAGAQARAATVDMRRATETAMRRNACGIVLDFSHNSGGNMWPMLVGLAPLLSTGPLGYFRDRSGKDAVIENRAGNIFMDGGPVFLDDAVARASAGGTRRIGIVIGPGSASSGEITAILFRGQPGTRFFGARTSGHSTANRTFDLPDGSRIALTTGTTLDRNRVEYGGPVKPDVATPDGVDDAARWVAAGCASAPR